MECGRALDLASSVRLAALTLAALAALLVAAPASRASHSSLAENNIPTIAQHQARGGASSISGVNCGATCQEWWLEEHRVQPGQPSSEALHRELRQSRIAVRVLPKLRLLGNIGLAVDTFSAGLLIGSGINAKWLKFGIPEAVPETVFDYRGNGYPNQSALVWHTAGFNPYFGTVILPEDGFVWRRNTEQGQYEYWRAPDLNQNQNCNMYRVTPPAGAKLVSNTRENEWCGYTPPAPATYNIAYYREGDFPAATAVEDYTGQPWAYSLAPPWPPPSQSELEDETRGALHSGNYPDLNEWYDFMLERAGSCNPLEPYPCANEEARDNDQKCDLDEGQDADPNPFADRFGVHTAMSRREESELVDTVLRWGHTYKQADGNWGGWGYRHIKAKHGWGPAERAATETALENPVNVEHESSNRVIYLGPEYEQGGVVCQRLVVVDPEQSSIDPAPREIVTSYGREVE